MSENTMSKSQAKRKARLEESKKAKLEAKKGNFIANLAVFVIAAIFVVAIGSLVYTKLTTTTSSNDYGALLNEDGTLKNVVTTDYIEPLDYKGIVVPSLDVTYTEEEMQTAIDSVLSGHRELQSDTALTAADGDTLNIDYVGTVDGVEFEGGNTNGAGADLTLGSGTYVDDFEDQLIGSHPGDQVVVTVTFPEDYSSADLAGKEAKFDVTVNGIYVDPEFTDEFVAENLSDKASTVAEYEAYLKETNEATKLNTYLSNYISENAVSKAPFEEHIKHLKAIGKYSQEEYYNSYNDTYIMMTGNPAYTNFSQYTGMSNKDFEAYLTEEATLRSTIELTYQYIFEDAGLTLTEDDYVAKTESIGPDATEKYGKAYVMQLVLQDKVLSYLAETVTVE